MKMTSYFAASNKSAARVDLHVHSHYSDGFNSMEEVVMMAKRNGPTEISFVDHDLEMNRLEAKVLSEKYDISIIPGIEISAYDFKRNRKVHILGYGYNDSPRQIRELCDENLKNRHEHSLKQIAQIKEAGYDLKMNDVLHYAAFSETIYKQHIMSALTNARFESKAYQALYKEIFKGNGVAAGDMTYVSAVKAVEAIVADGGIAVLAHPGQLDSFELVPLLVEHGLTGIERNHVDHSETDMQRVDELAEQFTLIKTGGSDFHGLYGKWVGVGEVSSPQSLIEILESGTIKAQV